jgi:hypothetical protein
MFALIGHPRRPAFEIGSSARLSRTGPKQQEEVPSKEVESLRKYHELPAAMEQVGPGP